MLRNAEFLHGKGLDSRIPFLKNSCTHEKVKSGSTAQKKDGVPVPQWKEGDKIHESYIEEVMRFNIFNAVHGLQALKSVEPDGKALIRIVRCITIWKGDLRINHVREDRGVFTEFGALYDWNLNQIIMRPEYAYSDEAFIHECEHARHTNLVMMASASLPILSKRPQLPVNTMEYLSMLAVNIETPYAPMLTIALRDFMEMWEKKVQRPHIFASYLFIANLLARYRIDPVELWKAAFALRKQDSSRIDGKTREKIQKCAQIEYDRVYKKIFGLTKEDINEVITSLPMI